MVDQIPQTFNPRRTLDAAGQRIGALLFFGLSRIDRESRATPILAQRWETSPNGRQWTFWIRPGLKDHRGDAITPELLRACLESYRAGKPASPLAASFPNWTATEARKGAVVLKLSAPDPYLPRNLSLLRYFRTEAAAPCLEPKDGERIWGSGAFKPHGEPLKQVPLETLLTEQELVLEPVAESAALLGLNDPSPLAFRFVRDENTRLLWLMRGEADAVLNGFSLSKTGWIRDTQGSRFEVLEREGATVEYLAFNLADPVLSRPGVRRAIALAIDRDTIIRYKNAGFSTPAGSFLPPGLAESFGQPLPYDPAESERLLEREGFRKDAQGVRLRLSYKATSALIGIERALLLSEMFRKVGIALDIQVVEPAVFFASLQKGAFQLYSSRWVGASDGSIYWLALRSGQPRNRVRYADPEMDRLLDRATSEMDESKRIALLRKIQDKMRKDLPYVPLWFWNNALVVDRRLAGLTSADLSIGGSYESLALLRRAAPPSGTKRRAP